MLYVIGIGPGNPDYLLPVAVKTARSCDVLAGGPRALALFEDVSCDKFTVTGRLNELESFLQESLAKDRTIGVLVSGDPGFYSLLPFLHRKFPIEKIQVIAGISSLQLAFAKAGLAWQEAVLTSAHGRPLEMIPVNPKQFTGLLTGKENSPRKIAEYLLSQGPNRQVFLGNNLGYPNEICLETDLQTLAADENDYANAVLIIRPVEDTDVEL